MIAHKKQFKIAGAIWLVIVMIICQIVPVFASPATDENGNWVPDHLYVRWLIYNPDTASYDYVNVTSSVTSEGLVFDFPYNVYGVQYIQFRLYSSSPFPLSSLLVSGCVYYMRNGFDVYAPLTLESANYSFYYGVDSRYFFSYSLDNPFSVTFSSSSFYSDVSSFLFNFGVSQVSGNFRIVFTDFLLNSEDISSRITVQNLDNASEDLSNLAEDLSVPTPNSNAIFNGMDDAINHVNDSNYQSTYAFFKNDTGIMATYITIVLAMATLGYIFFGKRSA